MSRNGKNFLLFISSGIIILVAFAALTTFCTRSLSSFRFSRAVICDEVDENFRPRGVSDYFSQETRQLCLWFEYSSEYDSCDLDVKWYFKDQLVSKESVKVSSPEGRRTLCLLREDGVPLPGGGYQVRIELKGRKLAALNFSIEEKDP